MNQRVTDKRFLRDLYQSMGGMSTRLQGASVEPNLLHLIEMRVSQINGCAFCLVMHADQLREGGERAERIDVLNAWREATWFSERERAALAFAESATLLGPEGVPDEVFLPLREQFNDAELADIMITVVAIIGWNRLNIALRTAPAPIEEVMANLAAD